MRAAKIDRRLYLSKTFLKYFNPTQARKNSLLALLHAPTLGHMSPTLQQLTQRIIAFRDARDWKQFHTPKDMAISLSLEAAEVLEHFQWKNPQEIETHLTTHKTQLAHELADVLYWVLLMSHDFGIDLLQASADKLAQSEAKYPVEKAKGKHTKYTVL